MIRNNQYQVESNKSSNSNWCFSRRVATFAIAVMFGVMALDGGDANALDFELGEDVRLDIDTSLTYGAAWRTQDADPKSPSLGDSNFEKGDMINNRFSALIDIDLQYKEYGVFVRPRAYYDEVYEDDKFFDETQDLHGKKAEILDAFVYGLFEPFGLPTSLRVGQQVASWGESLFILNGISAAMSPIDATAANIPGVELKDLFLPVGQVFGEISVTDNLTFTGFYQWEWEKSRIDETGAYFNTNNLVDDASHNLFGPLVGDPDDPDDQGQWGLGTRYNVAALNDTEFGLFFLNYHEKLPLINDIDNFILATIGAPGAGPYNLAYDEDVKLLGASVSGVVGDVNLAGEVSYRQDLSVPVQSPIFLDFEKADVFQAQASVFSILTPTSFYDRMVITGEVGVNTVTGGLDGNTLANDKTAWGGTLKTAFDYWQVMPLLDLNIPITWKFNPNGTSSVQGTFAEKNDSLGLGLEFTYKSVYKIGLGYTFFLFDADEHPKADRDFFSLNLKYTF